MAKAKFASLTAGLLARKGEAMPAAQSFAAMHGLSRAPEPTDAAMQGELVAFEERLVNLITDAAREIDAEERAAEGRAAEDRALAEEALLDVAQLEEEEALSAGYGAQALATVQAEPQRVQPIERVAPWQRPGGATTGDGAARPRPVAMAPAAAPGPRFLRVARLHRTAVTVRLDEARYLRLKLSGARMHRTNQDILTKALDAYLTALGIEPVGETKAPHHTDGADGRRAPFSRPLTD